MEFKDNEPIYLQIAAFVSDNILLGKWPAEQKIPSVRDLAVELEVNPNTVMRSYEFLQQQGVVYNKRGLGLFVAEDGHKKVQQLKKDRFMQKDLPEIFRNMDLLGIDPEDIKCLYADFKLNNNLPKTEIGNENK